MYLTLEQETKRWGQIWIIELWEIAFICIFALSQPAPDSHTVYFERNQTAQRDVSYHFNYNIFSVEILNSLVPKE